MKIKYRDAFLKYVLLSTVLTLGLSSTGYGQEIQGKVTDQESGEELAGLNIIVKGTNIGTATNLEGDFQLDVPSLDETLVLSYLGYLTQEVSIDGRTEINVSMVPSTIGGEELIVVGYGEQRRSDMTGAISSISSDEINEVGISSISQGMQGRSAGVYVNQSGNKPGQGASVRIRGNRSINAGNDPLFVVDGIPISGGLRDISPSDVQSIEVLKDASATAIYGARGSNGVVIVTTKRGHDGATSVTYDGSVGFSQMLQQVPKMNGEQFAEVRREAYRAAGDPRSDENLFHSTELEQLRNGTWTNYQDLITQRGLRQQHQLGISGGSDNSKYHVSFGGLDQGGILDPENFTRYNTRINIDLDITDRIRIGTSTLGSYSIQNGGNRNFYTEAVQNTPLTQPYDENGNLPLQPKPDAQRSNPLIEVLPETYVDEDKIQRLLSNIYAEFDITENFNYRMNLSPDIRSHKRNGYQAVRSRQNLGGPATAQYDNWDTFEYTWENIVNYQESFDDVHTVNLTGLFSIQDYQQETSASSVRGIPLEDMKHHNFGAAEEILSSESGFSRWSLVSYMGRANYNYDQRYLITATGRLDGSSRFGSENKWGFFPSLAFAWNIFNESFIEPGETINDLRLRLSWGQTGQTGIDPYQTQGLAQRTAYNFGDNSAFGFKPNQIRNDDLKWETTTSWNAGLQFDLFSSRIVTEVEVYRANTQDLLLERVIPRTSGFDSVLENVGATRNTGLEVTLTTQNLGFNRDFDALRWTSNLSVSYNKEEIVELAGGKVDDIGNRWFIGQPVNVYYDYEKIGIWQLDEADEAAKYGQQPGEIKVRDLNGDEQITG
ncbi:MAG: SusC/RagA family TonB-linked outer membrane protein, partial [Balneolales bacterium]